MNINNLHLSMIKNNAITGRVNLQCRREFFNAAHRPNSNPPNPGPASAAFGTFTSQANLARSIQMVLRSVW